MPSKLNKRIITPLLSLSVILAVSCNQQGNKTSRINPNQPHEITASEVIQSPSYTYVLATKDNISFWIATAKADVSEGENYFFSGALEMQDFTSEELGRTFDWIYFVNQLNPGTLPTPGDAQMEPGKEWKSMPEKIDISIDPPEGGVSVAELYENRNDFESKRVVVRGQVVRYSQGIMGRNWIHLQDGSGEEGSHDLTITTRDEISVGEIGTFEGVISLDKDFGAGYFYDLIMEDASLVSRKTKL